MIIDNVLTEGRCEGIFCIEAGFAWIHKNEIKNNADGIVMFDSVPHIYDNEIEGN